MPLWKIRISCQDEKRNAPWERSMTIVLEWIKEFIMKIKQKKSLNQVLMNLFQIRKIRFHSKENIVSLIVLKHWSRRCKIQKCLCALWQEKLVFLQQLFKNYELVSGKMSPLIPLKYSGDSSLHWARWACKGGIQNSCRQRAVCCLCLLWSFFSKNYARKGKTRCSWCSSWRKQ